MNNQIEEAGVCAGTITAMLRWLPTGFEMGRIITYFLWFILYTVSLNGCMKQLFVPSPIIYRRLKRKAVVTEATKCKSLQTNWRVSGSTGKRSTVCKENIKKREYTYNSKSVEPDSDSFDSVHHLVILCAKSVSVHNHCDCAFWIHRYY